MQQSVLSRILALCFLCFASPATAQMGWNSSWNWLKGDDLVDQPGVYGTQGVPAPGNKPGNRSAGVTWKDAAGNFWLYGGVNYDGSGGIHSHDDLWRYNPVMNEWTWIKGSNLLDQPPVFGTMGVASPANSPGARGRCVSWVDGSGKFWLFGGAAAGLGWMNDLWRYDPVTSQWTWMKGDNTPNVPGVFGTMGVAAPANKPGARSHAVGWTDKTGNFWLFGGYTSDIPRNDLWKYYPATNQWAWMGGSTGLSQNGTYGTQGVPAAANMPGARAQATAWTDEAGKFWLFAGQGHAATGPSTTLNDLWKYDPVTGQWTWMKGSNAGNPVGSGLPNVPDLNNTPGAVSGAGGQADTFGNLWLFGGIIGNATWCYDIATNIWILVKPPSPNGVYGVQAVPDPANIPGGRYDMSSWMDEKGRMYIFGGSGFASTPQIGDLSDLWRLECSNPLTPLTTNFPATVCPGGTYTFAVVPDPEAASYNWSLPAGWTGVSDSDKIIVTIGTAGGLIHVYSTNACPVNSVPAGASITVFPVSKDTVSQTICDGDSYDFYGTQVGNAGYYSHVFTSASGCDSTITLELSVNPIDTPTLVVTITQGSNPGCVDSLVEFTASSFSAGSSTYYTWYVNNTAVANGNVFSSSSLLSGDQVRCRLTLADSACLTTGTLLSPAESMVRVSKPGPPMISFIGNLLVSSLPNVQWYDSAGAIPGATGQSYHPAHDGKYYARQINPGCYSDPSNMLTVALLDIASYDLEQVKIYPNPTSGKLILDWGLRTAKVRLDVFHPSGRLVLQDVVADEYRKVLDLSMLPRGLYFLVIRETSGKMGTVKLGLQ